MTSESVPFSLAILLDGRPARVRRAGDADEVHVRSGQALALRITNRSPRPGLAVPSLDGRPLLTGRPAALAVPPGGVVEPAAVRHDGKDGEALTVPCGAPCGGSADVVLVTGVVACRFRPAGWADAHARRLTDHGSSRKWAPTPAALGVTAVDAGGIGGGHCGRSKGRRTTVSAHAKKG